jgi:hypothetical protein
MSGKKCSVREETLIAVWRPGEEVLTDVYHPKHRLWDEHGQYSKKRKDKLKKTKAAEEIFHTDLGVRVRIAEKDKDRKSGVVSVIRISDGFEFEMDRKYLREVKNNNG